MKTCTEFDINGITIPVTIEEFEDTSKGDKYWIEFGPFTYCSPDKATIEKILWVLRAYPTLGTAMRNAKVITGKTQKELNDSIQSLWSCIKQEQEKMNETQQRIDNLMFQAQEQAERLQIILKLRKSMEDRFTTEKMDYPTLKQWEKEQRGK